MRGVAVIMLHSGEHFVIAAVLGRFDQRAGSRRRSATPVRAHEKKIILASKHNLEVIVPISGGWRPFIITGIRWAERAPHSN
jgi:hypothetical protein